MSDTYYVVRVRILRAHPDGSARSAFAGEYPTRAEARAAAEHIRADVDGRISSPAGHAYTVTIGHRLADLAAAGRRDVLEHVALWHHRAGRPRAPIAAESGLSRAELGRALARRASIDHGLVTAGQVATHYGITEASARRLMSDHGVDAVRGYPAWLALTVPRPGRGARTDLAADRA